MREEGGVGVQEQKRRGCHVEGSWYRDAVCWGDRKDSIVVCSLLGRVGGYCCGVQFVVQLEHYCSMIVKPCLPKWSSECNGGSGVTGAETAGAPWGPSRLGCRLCAEAQ